jgi:hypothetical protein
MVAGALSPGVRRPESEADHSPPSTAEVKFAWSYTSTPPYVFMAYCLSIGITLSLPLYLFKVDREDGGGTSLRNVGEFTKLRGGHSRDSSVGTSTGWDFDSRQGYDFSLLNRVKTGSEAHPPSYPIGTGSSFQGGKEAGA